MTDNDYRPLFPTEPPRQTLERNRLQPPVITVIRPETLVRWHTSAPNLR